jgi:DNA repair protein SbcD/Mre11
MRLLHTADWHAGRNLRGLDRTPEIRDALKEILGIAVSEKVDAVLVAGDVFDTPNPSAEAEAAVYDFFLELGAKGIPSVVIAGNHDSAHRLESVAGLLSRVRAHVLGQVRADLQAVRLELEAGPLVVAGLPFLSERRLIKAADLLQAPDIGEWRQKYRDGMRFFVNHIAKGFSPDAVNIMMLHTTLEGGVLSGSEFSFHVSNSYCMDPQGFPSSAQYVALGHLHKPQTLSEAPLVQYSGSIVQLDFGEAGEQKNVNLIEVAPGRPAKVTIIPLSSGKTLRNIRTDTDGLERRLEELKGFSGHAKITVTLEQPIPGLKDRVMNAIKPWWSPTQLFAIETELKAGELERSLEQTAKHELNPLEAYKSFYNEARQQELPSDLERAFLELLGESHEQ